METCIKQEESTKNRLKSRSVDPRIWNYCKKIVGESYSLMETCIKQEESAKNRLKSNSFERSNVPNRSIRTDDIKSIPQSYIPSPSDYYKVVHRSSANNIKKSEIQKIEKLISKYGKPFIINLILDKRNNYITLRVGDELRDFGGRPGEEYVTSETILIDIENIGLTVNELDKLVQEQVAN